MVTLTPPWAFISIHIAALPCLPLLQICTEFSFPGCTFNTCKKKEGTARIVNYNEGVPLSYTIEASFVGPSYDDASVITNFDLIQYQVLPLPRLRGGCCHMSHAIFDPTHGGGRHHLLHCPTPASLYQATAQPHPTWGIPEAAVHRCG